MKLKMHSMSRNMCASLVSKVVALLAGIIVQRYILLSFGSTYNGLTSLVSQIISYLVLLEAGLGAASIQAFYAPLNENNWDQVNAIMNATASSYTKVGVMFGGLLIGGSLLVPLAISGEVDFFIAGLLTLITGAGNVFSYILGGKNIALLTADKKMYVSYNIDSVTTLCSAVLRIVALQNGIGIITVQAIQFVCVLLKNLVLLIYVKKKYPLLDKAVAPNFKAIRKRWNVLIHSIAGLVVNHTDVIIITLASSLKLVSVYNVYNMIYGQIGNVIQTTFMQAPQGEFGRLINKDKRSFENLYATYEALFTILLFILVTVVLILTRPFVLIYTRGVTDIYYIDFWLPVLFAIILIMNQVRSPAILTVNAVGAYKETQKGAIFEAIINLVVSLVLFFAFDLGIYGLLIGTICSYCYRTIDVICYVYKNIISRSIAKFIRAVLVNSACALLFFYLFCVRFVVEVHGYLQWVGLAFAQGSIVLISFIFVNILLNKAETIAAIKYLLGKLKSKQ